MREKLDCNLKLVLTYHKHKFSLAFIQEHQQFSTYLPSVNIIEAGHR